MDRFVRDRTVNAFRKLSDIFHALLGFIAGIVNLAPYGYIVSICITLIFVIYEALQAESPVSTYCDLTEYSVGFILAAPLLRR